jgi:hypothetical protein
MPINQIVVKFKDGSVKKGNTNDFLPNKQIFHLNTTDGEMDAINVENAKAIFFVKDFAGDKDHDYSYEDVVPGGGRKINVVFNDGEVVVGYALGYSPDRQGFMMTPADLSGNNERIYAVASAVKKVQFL